MTKPLSHFRILGLFLVAYWGLITFSGVDQVQHHDMLFFDDLSENKEASEVFDLDQQDLKEHAGFSPFMSSSGDSFTRALQGLASSPTFLANYKKGVSCGLYLLFHSLKLDC